MSANQRSLIKPKVEGRMIEKHYIGTADIGSSFDFSKKIRKTSQRKSPKVQISAGTTLRESSNGHAVKTIRLSLVSKGGSPASNQQRERKSSATRQMIGRNDTFEQSYSKIRRFIGRLGSSGATSKKSTVSTKLRTNETCRDNQTGSLYGVDASPIDMDNISPGHKNQSTPVYSEGSNKVKRSFTDQDALSPLEKTRISQIEAKLAFVLSKMNLRNCDKLSKESLENIKVAIEAEQAIQREENQVMFVSLERENQSLQAKAQQLNEECEQQRRMHMETLQKMEKQIIRLDDQVSDMQKIIGDQDRTITECNERLKKHMLGEVSPSAVQDLVNRPQATSKSIFEDFDGIFKSLLSDIKAKEKLINDLEKSRVSAPKENIKSDFSHLVEVNSGLKSFQSNQTDSLLSDVQQLQEQMRNISVKHGKDMKNMEVQFQQEIKALKCIHNDEKQILQIKVKYLEKELSDPKGPSYSGISEELNALNRKYKASVAEINHLRTKVGIMQKDKNRKSSKGELSSEHDLLTVGSNSKNKASLLSSGLPQPILAESANAFANITEESPTTLRTMAEGLVIREGNLTAKEQEILKKEVEVNQRINHIEEYTRHAEEQINQKVNEINEAEIEIDQKKKKLNKLEQELFTRERALKGLNSLATGDDRDHDQSTEARNLNTESNKIEKNDVLKSEKCQNEINKQAIEHMKEQMHIMSNNVVDLEKILLAERMEKERDRYQAAQVRKELERAKATIETLTDQLSKMGVAPKAAVLPHLSNSDRIHPGNVGQQQHIDSDNSSYCEYYMINDAGLRLPNNLSELTSSWVSNEIHKYTPQFSDLMQSHTLNAPHMDAKPFSESNPQRNDTKAVGNLTELQRTVHFAPPRPVRLDSGSFEPVESLEVAHNNYSVKVSEPTSTNKVTQSNGNYLGHSISPNLYNVRQTSSNNPVQVWPLGHFIGNDASEQSKFWESIKDNSSVSASRSYLQSSENKSQPAYPNQSKHPGLSN